MVVLLLLAVPPVFGRNIAQKKALARERFEKAEKARDELNAHSREQRTRRDYQRVIDAYRLVYYTSPVSSKSDVSVTAVAELLLEGGRQFADAKMLQAAIAQYEFLRREYPGSKYRVNALYVIGQIYKDDLNDREKATATFEEFLKRYPHSAQIAEARSALLELQHPQDKQRASKTPPPRAPAPHEATPVKPPAETPAAVSAPPAEPEAAADKSKLEHVAAREPVAPRGVLPLVTGIRYWSTPNYTRVAIDLEAEVPYQAGRVPNPDRIFFDLRGTKLAATLSGRSFDVQDGFLRKIRVAQYQRDMTRVVLEVDEISDYSAFLLPNPYRLIIDIHGRQGTHRAANGKPATPAEAQPAAPAVKEPPAKIEAAPVVAEGKPQRPPSAASSGPVKLATKVADGSTTPLKFDPALTPAGTHGSRAETPANGNPPAAVKTQAAAAVPTETRKPEPPPVKPAETAIAKATPVQLPPMTEVGTKPAESKPVQSKPVETKSVPETAKLPAESKPETKSAEHPSAPPAVKPAPVTAKPGSAVVKSEPAMAKSAPVVAKPEPPVTKSEPAVAKSEPAATRSEPAVVKNEPPAAKSKPVVVKTVPVVKPEPPVVKTEPDGEITDSATLAKLNPPELRTSKPTTAPTFESVAPRATLPKVKRPPVPDGVHEARPTADGDRSLIRALGLKIGRIVVDAGHGGHDTGTIGPGGLQEKDLTLDVALRLGKLLETKLGADVVYTRNDDTFIPLETRTALANQNQADLFISIHANSSRETSARGVETYYLNFTSSPDALEVAARENAVSEKSIHELQDLVKKIALKEKIEESREFATDVQRSLWGGLSVKSPAVRNRGVKKAPFIVLIGANMPSVLAEISFLSNPVDERRLQTAEYRQKVADYLYRGISRYVSGLSGVKVAQNLPQ